MARGSSFFHRLGPVARWGRATGALPLAPAGLVGTGEVCVMSVNRALHAIDEVTHTLERDVALVLLRASGDHFLAGVVFQRAAVDDHRAVHEFGLGFVGLLLCLFRDGSA